MQSYDPTAEVARALGLRPDAVRRTLDLFEAGATVPFIARYRKAQTGGLDEQQLRALDKSRRHFTELHERKQTVLRSIAEQGKLSDELRRRIEACSDLNTLEDLYLPYKPKRKTKAMVAIENGLEPLADLMLTATSGDADALARAFINGTICTRKEAIQGAQYILAERITENADIRAHVRQTLHEKGLVQSKKKETDHKEAFKFELYEDFKLDVRKLKPYQWLALHRGEQLGILSLGVVADTEALAHFVERHLKLSGRLIFIEECRAAIRLALSRYLEPSIEREVRRTLKEAADRHAVTVFSRNLRNLLLQPPLADKVVLGIDPGFASGCKVAVVGRQGEYLAGEVIYPTPPRKQIAAAQRVVLDLIQTWGVEVIAIGNGTASRETEAFVAQLIRHYGLSARYLITNEAGASVYSASEAARQEFPQLEAAERGNISIARRVQDPLAELVKIDPKSLGVGLYQHDVDQSMLENELQAVVESCVNEVGVDLNSASPQLLAHVSGLNMRLAQEIVQHRQRIGRFEARDQLRAVRGIGERTFEQAAGFLRIRSGREPLDNTSIHPESYEAVRRLARHLGLAADQFRQLSEALESMKPAERQALAAKLDIDPHTFELIRQNLARPGRDPRADVPPPILRSDILELDDLKIGMELQGTVRNVVDFGAFVDIGLKNDALLHVSKLGRGGRRITDPLEVVQVGDILRVRVCQVEPEKQRVSLELSGQ